MIVVEQDEERFAQIMKAEIIEIEGELGIVLPEEIVNRLKLSADSEVFLIENTDSLTILVDENVKNIK